MSPKLRISTIAEERDFKGGAFPYVILNRLDFMVADDWVIRMGRLAGVSYIRNGVSVTVAPYFTASPSGDGRVYGALDIIFDGTERWACARAVLPLSASITYPPSEGRGEIPTGETRTYTSNIDGRKYEYFGFYYGSKPKYKVSGDMSNLLEKIFSNRGSFVDNVKRVYRLRYTGRIFPRSSPRNQYRGSNSNIWELEARFGVELDEFCYQPNVKYSSIVVKEFEILLNGRVMTWPNGMPLRYVRDFGWKNGVKYTLFYTVEGIEWIRYTERGVPDHTKDACISGAAMLSTEENVYHLYYGNFDATEMNFAVNEMAGLCFPDDAFETNFAASERAEVCFSHDALRSPPCAITIPQVRVVPEMKYWGMNALLFTIPEIVVEIGVGAFAGNPNLKRLEFHNGTFSVEEGQNVFKVERYGDVWIVCSSAIGGGKWAGETWGDETWDESKKILINDRKIHINAVPEFVPTEILMEMLEDKDYKIREYAISQVIIDDDNLEKVLQMLSKEKEGGVIAKFLQRKSFTFDYDQLTPLYDNQVFIEKLKRYVLIKKTPLQALLMSVMDKFEQFREYVLSLQGSEIYPNPDYTASDLTEMIKGRWFSVELEFFVKLPENIPLIAEIFDKTVEEQQCPDQYEKVLIVPIESKNWKIGVKGDSITIVSPILQHSNYGELEAILTKLAEVGVIDTETEVIDPETEVIDPETKVIDTEVEVIDTEVEVVDTGVEVIDPQTEVIDTETEVIDPETEVIDTKTKVIDPETEVIIDTKTKVIDTETKNIDTETEVIDTETEVIDTKTKDIDTQTEVITEVIDTETEVIDTQTKDIDTQTEVIIDTQTKNMGIQTEVIDTKTEVIDTKTEVIDTKTEVIDTETKVIDPETEVIDTQTEVIDPQTEVIDPETEVIDTKTEVIDTETKVIDTQTEVIDPQTEVIDPQTEVIDPQTEVIDPKTKVIYTGCLNCCVRFIVTKFDYGPGLQSDIARVLTNFYINQGILREAFDPLKNFSEFDEERLLDFASAKDSKGRKKVWYSGVTKSNRGESNYMLDFHRYYIEEVVAFKLRNTLSALQESAVEAFLNFASAILSASISMYNVPPILCKDKSPKQSTDEFLRNIGLKGDEFARTRQTITGSLSDEPISPEELGAYEAKYKKYQSKR